MDPSKPVLRRPYQQAALASFIKSPERLWALLWERQAGKSTTLAEFALYEMLRHQNHSVIYGSASLLLAQEITLKTAIRANQSVSQLIENDATVLKKFADTAQSTIDAQPQKPASSHALAERLTQYHDQFRQKYADGVQRNIECLRDWILWPDRCDISTFEALLPVAVQSKLEFKTFDATTGKEIIGGRGASAKRISAAGFAELFCQQRLEFRVYYDRTSYSRTKVIVPNIATARSWSGTVLLDEVAFIRNLRELTTALLPVISTDKQFKLILSTKPPEFDDTHYSFELLAPPAGLAFQPNPEGNWYTSESSVRVHRADAFDTALAGKKIFDLKTGGEISPTEAFNRAPNKDGHRIAHWLVWMHGGSAACDLLRLRTAQERGAGQCQSFQINSDADMVPALNWVASAFAPQSGVTARQVPHVGLGFDVATTTKGKSNPSVISIMEEHGPEWVVRARFIWKTRDPEIANQRIHSILDVMERRGIRPRALAQDATNERYYAEQNRRHFRARVPVILVVASQAVDKPGLEKPTNWKEYLGQQLVAKLDDNNLTLPPDEYTRTDYRLVMKDRGRFVCEPNDQGMHGDCFDADKLAGHALTATSSRRTIVPPPWMPGVGPEFSK
jgi:hypothetical protein